MEKCTVKYTKLSPVGLGKLERQRLSAILRKTQATISVAEAADILGFSRAKAGKLLAMYANKGWLMRIYSGVYIPVPLESPTTNIVPEDPFIIAEKLFAPCYITGWSAAEHWGMTDQLYQSVIVMTQRQQKNYQPVIKDTEYLLHLAKSSHFFGLRRVWRNNVKVHIADPARMIIDIMNNPALGSGMRTSVDILKNYFNSKEKSVDLLISYLRELKNGAVYKRLGFLIEKYYLEEKLLINECQARLTAGNTKLDSTLDCNKLVTKWRLWVPANWKQEI